MRSYVAIAFFILLVSMSLSLLSQLNYLGMESSGFGAWAQDIQSAGENPSGLLGVIWAFGATIYYSIKFLLVTVYQSTIGFRDLLLAYQVPDPIATFFFIINLFSYLVLIAEVIRGVKL